MRTSSDLTHIVTFCGKCSCGCPELFLDRNASAEKRVVITDDFGQRIQMSLEQLRTLVADVKTGVLDDVLATTAI
ncbi:MAG: hypothetical protein JO100_04200 [Pseudonocardia sp.]|nr:hypothetical protein [Pseudonocardia sp.]